MGVFRGVAPGTVVLAFAGTLMAGGSGSGSGAGDLDCAAVHSKPRLDYEFRFTAFQGIRLPAAEFAGEKPELRVMAVVRAIDPAAGEPVITIRRVHQQPSVPQEADRSLRFGHRFAFGAGVYKMEWTVEADDGRSCRLDWRIEAKRDRRRALPQPLAPGEVVVTGGTRYRREDSVIGAGRPLRLKVLLNLDPPRRRRRAGSGRRGAGGRGAGGGGGRGGGGPRAGGGRGGGGGPRSGGGRGRGGGRGPGAGGPGVGGRRGAASPAYAIGVLRSLSRDPRIGQVALVAYSVEDQKTLLRHGFAAGFDYPSLREASQALDPHRVDYGDLAPESDNVFFGDMLVRELAEEASADLYVFLGPESQIGQKPPAESLRKIGEPAAPVFYFNSTRGPRWKGLIGHSVKTLGGKQLRVQSPEDLWKAMGKMLGQVARR